MAKRKTQPNSRKDGGRYAVPTSSGYTVIVNRPPLNVVTAVQKKAETLYPMPEPPPKEMEMISGVTRQLPAFDPDRVYQATGLDGKELAEALQAMTEQEQAFYVEVKKVQGQRTEHLLEYIFQKRLQVEGIYDDEQQQQQLMDAFADDQAEMDEWGEPLEALADLDPWQRFLRTWIIQDQTDYAAVYAAAMWAFNVADITEEEIRDRVRFLSS